MSEVLYLSLIKEWFYAIVFGNKREEYREINPYWLKRLYEPTIELSRAKWDALFGKRVYENTYSLFMANVRMAIKNGYIKPKDYKYVEFALGYPKKDDAERRKRYAVKEISIGFGHPTWGAPTKRVFIIRF